MINCRLSPLALGLAAGVLWGVSILIMGLIATYYAYGRPFVEAMSVMYTGYEASIKGSFLGGAMGFIDAFIGALIFAWLYNLFSRTCNRNCTPENKSIEEKPLRKTKKITD